MAKCLVNESGDIIQKRFIGSCLAIWTRDPNNVDNNLPITTVKIQYGRSYTP